MKSIQPTRSKTRKGVLAWLLKFNSKHQIQALDHSSAIAVHVDRYTGEILYWEMPTGSLVPASFSVAA